MKKEFLGERTNASKVELDEVQLIDELTQSSKPTETDLIRSNLESIIDVLLRRSGRVSHQPDRYYDFLIQNGDPIELNENNKDPITYMDVI